MNHRHPLTGCILHDLTRQTLHESCGQVAHLLRARLVAAFHSYRDEEAVQATELLLVTAHFLQP